MAAVASPAGPVLFEAVVIQDAGLVMTAITKVIILIAFRGTVKYLVASLQYGREGRAVGAARP
jgi:hypothetical protein